ncbi:MAG TPA: hypothetical protein VMI56_11810 [Reyranella sp.]|nr:hypothetical protein [Reyranella sp.]
MKKLICRLAGVALPALMAQGASAASPADVQYCERLTELYLRYVGSPDDRPPRTIPANIGHAMATCRSDTDDATAVLERALRNNRFTLPRR